MASNTSTLVDEDGDYSDWIEIQNVSLPVVNLAGWFLTDDAENLTKWTFPSVELLRGDAIIVFASDKNRAVEGSQLHASFKLEASGEFLALVKPDGVTIAHAYSPSFPQQFSDVSYGLEQTSWDFAQVGDSAAYHVPVLADAESMSNWPQPLFDDSSWLTGSLGMGFPSISTDQFSVTVYRSNIPVSDLATAEGVIADPATQISVTTAAAPMINYLNTGGSGHYGSDATFPGMTIGVDVNDFVVEVTGAVVIPTAGNWTFGVNSDDGFGLTLSRFPHVYSSSFPGPRGASDTLADFNLIEAGRYDVRLVCYERAGGSSLEFFAAPGSFSSFNAASFDLVGNVAAGGLHLAGLDDELHTNLEPVMRNVNSSVWLRRSFTVADPSLVDSLFLKVQYEDGLAAFLNGTELTRQNAPVVLAWNSAAPTNRSPQDSQNIQTIDLSSHAGLLTAGTNVLAIHALNDSAADAEFFVVPKLSGMASTNPASPLRYFSVPTPAAANNSGFPGVAHAVQFSSNDATFTAPFDLTLSTDVPGAVIRFTLDNSVPTESTGLVYTAPIPVSSSTQVRARAFESGLAPSPIGRRLFSKLNPDVLAFQTNLPLVVVDTFGFVATQNWYTLALTSIRNNLGGRTSMTDPVDFVGATGFKIRGSSSTSFPKKQYAMETWDADNKDLDAALLGFPGDSDWILYGPYTDKSLMRDFLAYRWSNEIGRYAVRTRFVEVFFDQNGGGVSMADYAGVYILQEKIKQAPQRVNIDELSSANNSLPEITGGYMVKKDRLDPGDTGFLTGSGQRLAYVYPKETEITAAQATYLKGYFDTFESALYGPGFADPVTGYAAYIDVGSFFDHHIMVEMTKNIDGFRLSTFMFKDRGGKLNMGPVWDYNLTMGNANYLEGWLPTGWYHSLLGDVDYPWWNRLFQDPEFAIRYADRWHQLRRTTFQTSALIADIDEIASLLDESQQRNYVRWPILGTYVWPNYFIGLTYYDEIEWMKQWLRDRLTWMDAQLSPPPIFGQQGGVVSQFFELTMTSMSGSIYYTLDGSDPRLQGGGVNLSAQLYTAPAVIAQDSHIIARSLDGVTWSALNDATFDIIPIAVVNEVLPLNALVNVDESGDHDPWIELYNPSTATADLSGFFLTNDPAQPGKWAFPAGTVLCGHSWLLIWADNEPGEGPLHTNFTLASGAGLVRLSSPSEILVDELARPTLLANQSYGRLPDAALAAQAFSVPTPAAENRAANIRVFLNEYNAVAPANLLSGSGTDPFWGRVAGNGGDWFELVVASDHADIRGWKFLLSDDTGGGSQTLQTLTLTNHAIWSDLRAGTIITVSEDLPSNISYNPAAGDWWINVQASASASGAYITNQNFEVSQRNWQLTIKNALNIPQFGPSGEGIKPASGVGNDEVCKLEENPSQSITPLSNFQDGSSSSFGAPNIWSSGTLVQDFSALRVLAVTPCITASNCDDGDICTTDTCVTNQCVHSFNSSACDDGNPCTSSDACTNGICSGEIVNGCCQIGCDCDDDDPCTSDSCLANLCFHAPASGQSCDDLDLCTLGDVCQAGICAGLPRDCSSLSNACNAGVCVPMTGLCGVMSANEGDPCDDGDACTVLSTCQSGQCAGTPVDCTALDSDCRVGLCNQGTGNCESVVANEGGPCSDTQACTVGDICVAGACTGTNTCCTMVAIGSRYLQISPPPGMASMAIQIESDAIDCLPKYVDADGMLSEIPVFRDSSAWAQLEVADREIVPGQTYSVRSDIRLPNAPPNLSPAASATTWTWGDTNHVDGVNLFDVLCVLDGFADVFTNCTLAGVDLQGSRPNHDVDLFDIVAVLDGFQGIPYPDSAPCSEFVSPAVADNSTYLSLAVSSRRPTRWGEELVVDVFAEGDGQIRAYELRLRAVGTSGATVVLDRAWVDTDRNDYVFSGSDGFTATDRSRWRLANAVTARNLTLGKRNYLASFGIHAVSRKSGEITIGFSSDSNLLLNVSSIPRPTVLGPSLEIQVAPAMTINR